MWVQEQRTLTPEIAMIIPEFKIDKNIAYVSRMEFANKWPFSKMDKGDSFEIPAGIDRQKIRSAMSHYAKRKGGKIKFSIRGQRCWRIA